MIGRCFYCLFLIARFAILVVKLLSYLMEFSYSYRVFVIYNLKHFLHVNLGFLKKPNTN